MISISDATRNVLIKERPDFAIDFKVRGTLYKTLDGGAFIFHAGAHEAGQDFNITAILPDADVEKTRAMFMESTQVYISTRYGAFKGAIASFKNTLGKIEMNIWVSDKG
jgi:hypothetical protein